MPSRLGGSISLSEIWGISMQTGTHQLIPIDQIQLDKENPRINRYIERKLVAKGLDLSATTVTNQLIVDAKIEVFDDFINEIKKNPHDLPLEASRLDLQKLYTNLLWKELAQQTDEDCKYAPERSWSDLKSALNVYFRDKLKISNPPLYAIICNDLQKEDGSSLRPLISKALKAYASFALTPSPVSLARTRPAKARYFWRWRP